MFGPYGINKFQDHAAERELARKREAEQKAKEAATVQEKPYDEVSKIIDYESGLMGREEVIEFFQHLIKTGLCWRLQGAYGRTAQRLIDEGYCDPA